MDNHYPFSDSTIELQKKHLPIIQNFNSFHCLNLHIILNRIWQGKENLKLAYFLHNNRDVTF